MPQNERVELRMVTSVEPVAIRWRREVTIGRAWTVPIPERPPPLALVRPMSGVESRMRDVTRSALDQDRPDIDA